MNKAELIAKIADDAGISKVQAEKALGAFTGAVTDS
ncbi:MAG: DNA-binding protein HU, partial [Candidatus Marinimicrobia bacterium]|nr:DNA-binding protein HU [Candidatus Neomarinimicrobiota bacterium]MBT5997608.1 DNA-binding protein HU [Candidatus Neomarinimicrobiota bacterium]MBT6012596.1 DNA-binding protein HU [Candidatus Neomarinimicrobiota bacterium]